MLQANDLLTDLLYTQDKLFSRLKMQFNWVSVSSYKNVLGTVIFFILFHLFPLSVHSCPICHNTMDLKVCILVYSLCMFSLFIHLKISDFQTSTCFSAQKSPQHLKYCSVLIMSPSSCTEKIFSVFGHVNLVASQP